jgi:unsaturated rhamnogalacturonyl hydrolase
MTRAVTSSVQPAVIDLPREPDGSRVARPLGDRVRSAALAALAYWYYRWDWGEAIGIDGTARAAAALGWSLGVAAVDAELDEWITRGDPSRLGPCTVLLSRRDELGAQRSLDLLIAIADRVVAAPRSPRGVVMLDGDDHVFVDSLYDTPAFLWQLGQLVDVADYRATALAIALGHTELLQDQESGLMRHFASPPSPSDHGVHWGRGNGWAALGLSDLLHVLPRDLPERTQIRARYRRLIESLVSFQTTGGTWRNIVDDGASVPEASTTALIEAAITQTARDDEIDDASAVAAERAWDAIEHRIDASGHFLGVTFRPGINVDPARYEHVPAVGVYPWGNGAFLRSAAQRLEGCSDGGSM